MTDWADVRLAMQVGADYFGMIFASSPRRIDWDSACEIAARLDGSIAPVAVFVDPQLEDVERVQRVFPNACVQLCGDESPEFVEQISAPIFKVVHVGDDDAESLAALCERYPSATILFDTATTTSRGGSGQTFVWQRVDSISQRRRTFIAGGLTVQNVATCIDAVRPFGVDVRSGIETNGRKDAQKMRAFMTTVRERDAA